MESPSAKPKKPSSKSGGSARTGWIAVSNGIEFLLVPRSELAEAEATGFYRPEDRGKTVITKDGRLYEVESELRESAIDSGFKDLVAREKKRSPSKVSSSEPKQAPEGELTPSSDSQPTQDESQQSESQQSESQVSESGPVLTPSIDDLLPGRSPATPVEPQTPLDSEEAPNADSQKASNADAEHAPDELMLVAQAVEQVEREAEQTLIEREEEISSLVGWRQTARRLSYWLKDRQDTFFKRIGTNGISIALHLVILMLLSCVFLVNEKKKDGFLIVASPTSEEIFIEEIQIETEPVEPSEPEEAAPAETTPVEEISMEVDEIAESPDFLASVKSDSIKPPVPEAKPAKNPADGAGKSLAKPTFFSSSATARNFVFVIDNSNSMTRGRFETALIQLMLTVNQLTPKQRYYVIFYSDTAYGLMHPRPLKTLVPATVRNKRYLEQWLNTVPLCLRTNGKEAIQAAFDLDPDVIYVLGDGAFGDKAAKHFISNPHPTITLHTRGMEVPPNLAKDFEQLAKKHRGTYKDVGVMPQGLRMSKLYPRPRNNKRGQVWGIKLPVK